MRLLHPDKNEQKCNSLHHQSKTLDKRKSNTFYKPQKQGASRSLLIEKFIDRLRHCFEQARLRWAAPPAPTQPCGQASKNPANNKAPRLAGKATLARYQELHSAPGCKPLSASTPSQACAQCAFKDQTGVAGVASTLRHGQDGSLQFARKGVLQLHEVVCWHPLWLSASRPGLLATTPQPSSLMSARPTCLVAEKQCARARIGLPFQILRKIHSPMPMKPAAATYCRYLGLMYCESKPPARTPMAEIATNARDAAIKTLKRQFF